MDERNLIEGTIRDLEEAIERIKDRIDVLQAELGEKNERLTIWRSRLAKLRSEKSGRRSRKRKGENFRAVVDFLKRQPNRGLSMSEIATGINIPWSSVRAVLKKHGNVFEEKAGLWCLRLLNGNGDERGASM